MESVHENMGLKQLKVSMREMYLSGGLTNMSHIGNFKTLKV